MASWTGRTVVYGPLFDGEIERLKPRYPRLEEALTGLEWALSNRPEIFPLLYGSRLRMATIDPAPGVPYMRVWFTSTEREVHVIFAEECEEDDG